MNETMLARAIDTTAMGDLFPYVKSVSGPKITVPASVVISYTVSKFAI